MPDLACLRCGSTNLFPELPVQSMSSRLLIDVPTNPEALLLKGVQTKQLYARICGSCGHMELYIEGARELWDKYQKANND